MGNAFEGMNSIWFGTDRSNAESDTHRESNILVYDTETRHGYIMISKKACYPNLTLQPPVLLHLRT